MSNRDPLHDIHELQTTLPVLPSPPEDPPAPFSTNAECMDFVREQWKVNNDMGRISDLLYPSTVAEQISTNVVSTWLRMEQYCRQPTIVGRQRPTGSGGNVLLTGSKGVGKTTLMKGLAVISNRYSGRVLAVYRNFEEVDNVRGPSQDVGFDGAFRTETYDEWCLQNRRCLIFFGDEFGTLYTKESIHKESSVRIAREILSLGKSTLGLGIISGSSACLTSLAYKEGPNKYSDFPNMNSTVFVHHRWPPVREKRHLEDILRLKGRDSLIEHVQEVFCQTGGVGRLVEAFRDVSAFECTTALPSIQGLVNDPRYGQVIRQLYVANYNGGHPVDYFQQKGLTDRDRRLSNHDHHRAIVMELMDMNVVHMDGIQSRYEFLYPYHLQILRETVYADGSHLEPLALETTLKGWQGFGSAGQVLAPLIIRTLVSKRRGPFSNTSLKYDDWEWRHGGGALGRVVSRGTEMIVSLDLLWDTICIPIPDHGLDSFVLLRGEGTSTVSVEVTQFQCGEFGKKITPGGAKSADPSKFFTAILTRANAGWTSLLAALKASFPETEFTLASFALVTNQEVAADVASQVTVMFGEHPPVPFMFYSHDDFNDAFDEVLRMFNWSPT